MIEKIKQGQTTINYNDVLQTTFYDVKRIYDIRRAKMVLGQGIDLKSDNKQIVKLWNKMKKINKLDDLFLTYLYIATANGVLYSTISKINNKWIFEFADPDWVNIIDDIRCDVFGAKIRKSFILGYTYHYIDEYYDDKGNVRREYSIKEPNKDLKNVNVEDFYKNPQIPKEYILPEKEKLPFTPIFKYLNQSNRNLNKTNIYNHLREDYNVQHIPVLINDILRQIWKHTHMSKDRIIGNISPKEQKDLMNSQEPFATLTGDAFIKTEPNVDGNNTTLTLQEAKPKHKEYMQGLMTLLNEYMRGREMSPIDDSTAQQTQAETLFSKSLDVESCKIINKRFTEFLCDMLDKIFIAEGLTTEDELLEDRPYALELKENIVFNELQLSQHLITMIENGLMSKQEAIVKLRNVDMEEAKEILEQITKEQDIEQEKQMEYQMSMMETQEKKTPLNEPEGTKNVSK